MDKTIFILVIKTDGSYTFENEMEVFHTKVAATNRIGSLSDDETLIKAFEVSERGTISFYKAVFDGRLKLEKYEEEED